MGKALDILKYIRNNDYIMDFLDKAYIKEAIKELEEAMQPKTCAGCKQSWEPNNQTFHKYFCEYLKIPVHSNFCCNRHEPKE